MNFSIDFFEAFLAKLAPFVEHSVTTQVTNFIFMLSLGFYLIQSLQWFNYSIWRILTKHTKYQWHLFYVIFPSAMFFVMGKYFCFYLVVHLIALSAWFAKLDKKLVWTNRVRRFFATCVIFLGIEIALDLIFEMPYFSCFVTLGVALVVSKISEFVIMLQYRSLAKEKLSAMPNLKIIAITASFGKTSMKNFINELLCKKYKTYATPRSVNTIDGIIADINDNLSEGTEIYIVEAGARKRGDIAKIAHFLNHQIAVIGEVGEAHLEYFKSIENTRATKYELVQSPNLTHLYFFKDNFNFGTPQTPAKITPFPCEVQNAESTLFGTKFRLDFGEDSADFETKILGRFNITNISVAVMIARDLGVEMSDIVKMVENLHFIPHRLEKIEANGKVILDDSFNGNLNGMKEAIRLSAKHTGGKKIIVTPGLVESSVENNTHLALLIDKIFDIAIITGDLNSALLARNITHAQKVILQDKADLQNILASFTHSGDLILFANDAPNYI
ncbi:Mur ligase family protein [Helicobacter sp. 23-1045]